MQGREQAHTWEIHSVPARLLAEQDHQQDRMGLKMQGENQWGVSTAKCLNLETWGHSRGQCSCTQQKAAPVGPETKPAPGCMPVCQARAPAATSVPAPFIPCFKKKQVAQGPCVLPPYKAWEGGPAGSWGCRAALAQVLLLVGITQGCLSLLPWLSC